MFICWCLNSNWKTSAHGWSYCKKLKFVRGYSFHEYRQENEQLKKNEELISTKKHKKCYFRKRASFVEFQWTSGISLKHDCILITYLYLHLIYLYWHLITFTGEVFKVFTGTIKSSIWKRALLIKITVLWHVYQKLYSHGLLFQTETETVVGFYCHASPSFLTSSWFSVSMLATFALWFVIPFSLILHNYVRIGRTLFQSLKERLHLKEGIETKWVVE